MGRLTGKWVQSRGTTTQRLSLRPAKVHVSESQQAQGAREQCVLDTGQEFSKLSDVQNQLCPQGRELNIDSEKDFLGQNSASSGVT